MPKFNLSIISIPVKSDKRKRNKRNNKKILKERERDKFKKTENR